MDRDTVTLNEFINNGSEIHLYYHSSSDMWMAYGYSAYMINKILTEKEEQPFMNFSKDFQMPYVACKKKDMKMLIDDYQYLNSKPEHLKIQNFIDVDPNEYYDWVHDLKHLN